MMTENVLVSIVLPCYNAEAYIKDAVNSMLNQTYKNIELIVVNDCSTDRSLQILETYTDERLKVISNEKNLGYPGSMNNGISIAKGKYIARMDADDICTPNRIQKQVKLHEQHPNCAFVSAQRCLLSPIGIAYSQIPDVSDDSYCVETWEDLYYGTRKFTDASSLIMKAHIMAVGGYNTYQRSGMDVDLWFRIMEHTEADVLVLNEFLYQRRLIPEAITFSVNTNNTLVFDKAYERYKGKQAIAKHTINEPQRLKSYIRFLSTIAVHCWCVKDYSGAWAFLKKALSYKQFIYNSVVLNVFKKIYYFKITKPLQLING